VIWPDLLPEYWPTPGWALADRIVEAFRRIVIIPAST
jgi:hypothetical protein